jgi:hypothetical protein
MLLVDLLRCLEGDTVALLCHDDTLLEQNTVSGLNRHSAVEELLCSKV